MGRATGMKIYFMLGYARDKADAPMLAEVIANLRAEGFDVAAEVAETVTLNPEELRVGADLYVLKSKTALWLNLAAVLDAQGARILNSYPASVNTLNKIRTAYHLSAAQVPIPRSWVTGDLAQIPEITDTMPLLLKPNIGHGGAGIRIIRDRAELAATQIEDGMLVQELIEPVEDELKLYVIGDRVFGIRKHLDSGVREPVAVEPLLEDIALRSGRALGLEIYGVDVLISSHGQVVVDVNYFPSFRGVPDVARSLTDYISNYAKQ
jgi:ribosomal protein S6--L-glutamate ligase